MRYRLRSVDELRACLCRIPDGIRVEVERGLAMSAETVADLRSLSTLPPVCTEKSDSDVLMMQPADEGLRYDASDPLDRSR
jgi:hypothetical protein